MATLSDGTEARVLAESNGFQVLQAGQMVYVVDRGWGWVSTATFVFALVGFLLMVGPLVLAFVAGEPLAAFGVLAGLLVASGAFFVRKARERMREAPVAPRMVLLVIDVGASTVRDAGGQALCPLAQLEIGRAMQIGSSSAALRARWPGGKRIIARGTPFGGDVGPIEATLRRFVPARR